jgi:hypothetical protein
MVEIQVNARRLFLAAGLAVALPASAGAISGTLTKPGNKPLGIAEVKLTCGSTNSTGKSDANGNYSLSIAALGLCTLTVGDAKSASVLLGKDPARYNFEVPEAGVSLLQR